MSKTRNEQLIHPDDEDFSRAPRNNDAIIGPSLPPFVEGQLRCFLHLSIGELKWTRSPPAKNIQAGVKWWGQQSKQVILEPTSHLGHERGRPRNEVKYPIRSGPKQFSAYLKDMGLLNIDIIANGDIIGQVNIENIGVLCHSRPIQGFYSIISSMRETSGKEIGMVYASLTFHSVSGSFNMTSSTIPTTDMSFPFVNDEKPARPAKLGRKKGAGSTLMEGGDRKKKSKAVKISSAPPERIEYSFASETPSFVVGPGKRYAETEAKVNDKTAEKREHQAHGKRLIENSSEMRDEILREPQSVHETPKNNQKAESRAISDALAKLIERGQNLRNKMLLSTIETPHKFSQRSPDDGNGNLLKDILDQIDEDDSMNASNQEGISSENACNVDKTLVDLVAGDETHRIGQMLTKLEQISDASLSDEFTDTEDPLYEDSLLNELFYTENGNESIGSSVSLTEESDENEEQHLNSSPLKDAGNKRPNKRMNVKGSDGRNRTKSDKKLRRQQHKYEDELSSFQSVEDDSSMAYLDPISMESDPTNKFAWDESKKQNEDFTMNMHKVIPEGMDLDAVTILARVQFARVIINALHLSADALEKYSKCTFFVEYDFPVSSVDNGSTKASYSELTRFASNKISDQCVLFNHRSVFPVHFDGSTIAAWWNRQLNFRIHARCRTAQTPELIDTQSVALQKIFLTEGFAVHENLVFRDGSIESKANAADDSDEMFGNLSVSIELASEREDMRSKRLNARTAVDTKPSQTTDKPVQMETELAGRMARFPSVSSRGLEKDRPLPNVDKSCFLPEKIFKPLSQPDIVLKSLLCVPEGRSISKNANDHVGKLSNCYLVCRMFWDEKASRSKVCWNTADPEFQFFQTTPIVLNTALLERAVDNFMVIEVWDKSLSANDDQLLGIVKVSLHPFYLSFRDQSVSKALLKSQYPVIAVDGLVKIYDLFRDKDCGHLRVLFALGTQDQINNLLRMKGRQISSQADATEVISNIGYRKEEEAPKSSVKTRSQQEGDPIDHIFTISIENAKVLGRSHYEKSEERDCFVQYRFPDQKMRSKDCSLAWYKTPTTLFVENPVFGYSHQHIMKVFEGSSVQRLFLNSFEQDSDSSGIPFEIWTRSYFPNVRDCLLFKAMIPTAKIYALMTMSRGSETSLKNFALPLFPVNANTTVLNEDSQLNVSISYQQKKNIISSTELSESRSPCVCISVSILRACGLMATVKSNQPGKENLTGLDRSGVNAFVKVYLSFLGNESSRVSTVIPRSFAPTFSFHVDFPVYVIQDVIEDDAYEDYEEPSTLAYHLESGYLEIQLFHKCAKSGFVPSKWNETANGVSEVLLGTCRVPLIGLLSRNTGIKSWYPVQKFLKKTGKSKSIRGCDADEFSNFSGGIEVSLKFGRETDRELVINTARGVGWSPFESLDTHEDSFNDAAAVLGLNAYVSVEKVWIAREVFDTWRNANAQNVKIYCRYKFYDKAALATKLVPFEKGRNDDVFAADLKHKKSFKISASSAFSWYLREELIEFQFWLRIAVNDKGLVVNHSRDKLIGSVFIDASGLARNPALQGSVSGLYPLYKFGADFLGKSSARVSVHVRENDVLPDSELTGHADYTNSFASDMGDDPEDASTDQNSPASKIGGVIPSDDDFLKCKQDDASGQVCRVIIEEALHLPVEMTSLGTRPPSTYACYQISPLHEVVSSSVVSESTKPKWFLEKMEKLDLCKIPHKAISFKVFKKATNKDSKKPDMHKDVQLGTATVDVSLLAIGFRHIHGWYNLIDFSGEKAGQIKVGIIPETTSATSPSARYFRKEILLDKVRTGVQFSHDILRSLGFDKDPDTQLTKTVTDSAHHMFGNEGDAMVSDTSRSILCTNLQQQIASLDSLTKELRQKLKEKQENPLKEEALNSRLELSTKSEDALVYARGIAALCPSNITHDDNQNTEKTVAEQKLLGSDNNDQGAKSRNTKELKGCLLETPLGESLQMSDADFQEEICVEERTNLDLSEEGLNKTFDSFDDVLSVCERYHDNVCTNDGILDESREHSCNDQTNEHLIFDNHSNKYDYEFDDLTASDIQGNLSSIDDVDSSVYGASDLNVEKNAKESQSPQVSEMLSENRAQEIVTITRQDQNIPSSLSDDDIIKERPRPLKDASTADDFNESAQEEDEEHIDERGNGLTSQGQMWSNSTSMPSEIPNFFMPAELLAQSMEQLKLKVNRKSDVIFKGDDIKSLSRRKREDEIARGSFHTVKHNRVSIDKPPPLESTEMNRIASIFATKFA